jgi:hypothetical protein
MQKTKRGCILNAASGLPVSECFIRFLVDQFD